MRSPHANLVHLLINLLHFLVLVLKLVQHVVLELLRLLYRLGGVRGADYIEEPRRICGVL
jgi:hypothetical protein